ncbi:MAG: hypothetical protein HRU35_07435 [Rickettsiaceae bacterium]|nr:hypothetical protein [Rickettsiaceae bacterium]
MVDIIFLIANFALASSYISTNIFYLRVITCFSDSIFIIGTLIAGLHNPGMKVTLSFSVIAIVINVLQITRLFLLNKPVKIPTKLNKIYKELFSELSTKEFMILYKAGETKNVQDSDIIAQGEKSNLVVVLNGDINIKFNNNTIQRLSGLHIFGEVIFLTDQVATATVHLKGSGKIHVWPKESLEKIKRWNPEIHQKLQLVFTKHLALKLINRNISEANNVLQKHPPH